MTNRGIPLAKMDCGKSLRLLMADKEITGKELAGAFGSTETTISALRHNKLMSGKNIVMLATYFNVSTPDFIRRGIE